MANSHEIITVQPNIPAALVNATDLEILTAIGFRYEIHSQDESYYFYLEDGVSIEIEIEDVRDFYRGLRDDYPFDGFQPVWVERLEEATRQDAGENYAGEYDLDNIGIDFTDVFYGILRKPQNADNKYLSQIYLQAAFYSDKASPDSAGGWAMLITRNFINSASTQTLLRIMQKGINPQLIL